MHYITRMLCTIASRPHRAAFRFNAPSCRHVALSRVATSYPAASHHCGESRTDVQLLITLINVIITTTTTTNNNNNNNTIVIMISTLLRAITVWKFRCTMLLRSASYYCIILHDIISYCIILYCSSL